MVKNNSIFNTKYAEFSRKWQVLLHFHNPTCAYNCHDNLHQKLVPLLSSIFTYLFHPYFITKFPLQSPITLPFSLPQQFFTYLFLGITLSKISGENFFSASANQLIQMRQGTRQPGSLVRADTVLNSIFFLKVWTVITGLRITDSLSLILRIMVHFRQQSQTIVVTSSPY